MSDALGKRLINASAVLTLLVALIFGAMLYAIGDLRDAGRQERHSERVIAASSAMQALLLNLETSTRGFVITREDPFLGPWTRNVADFAAQSATFAALVRNEPEQRRLERQIVAGVRSYIRDYSRPLVATARRDPAAAVAIVRTGEGKRRVDALRDQFGALVTTQRAVSAGEQAQADRAGALGDPGRHRGRHRLCAPDPRLRALPRSRNREALPAHGCCHR